MLSVKYFKISVLWLFFLLSSVFGEQSSTELLKFLNTLPVKEIKTLKPSKHFTEEYEIVFSQILDHSGSENITFPQRIFVSFFSDKAPVVLITEGYSCGKRNYLSELSEMLNANQIRVEYRFYGKSVTDTIPWKFLNYFQSSNDYHYIKALFSKYFKGKWISTGWSKGGQTALIYRRFFPDDVSVTVAYDAPLNLSLTDKRIDDFFDEVGTPEFREKIIAFQRLVLKNKLKIVPMYEKYCKTKGYTFKRITPLKSIEYCVLEYPFSFWQYHNFNISEIPDSTKSFEKLLNHLLKVVNAGSYTDRAFDSVSMYQFSTELGYYGYVTKNVSDLLSEDRSNYTNTAFAPSFLRHEFNHEFMKDVIEWLLKKGEKIVYVYGENDPWSAPSIEIPKDLDAVKVYVKNGNHYSFIRNLGNDKQKIIISALHKWLNY